MNVDLMIERETEKLWEEQTRPEIDGETLRLAARSVGWAVEELDRTADFVNEAAETLVDTPEGDRLLAILNDMENMLINLKETQKRFEKGVTK